MNNETIRYYDMNAAKFVADTEHADMRSCRERFLHYLDPGQKILDAGCGSGRDVIAFRKAGYEVDAFDASAELCKISSEKTGIKVRHLRFEELEGNGEYDGIWACASLLHVNAADLPDVMNRLHRVLKPKGILYASFKLGTGERESNGRYYHDLTEANCRSLLRSLDFDIVDLFISTDVRENRKDVKWINVIARKEGIQFMD